jgi:hypothetical protein
MSEQTTEHEDQAADAEHEDQAAGEHSGPPTLEGLAARVEGLAAQLDRLLSGPAPAAGTAAAAERSVAQEVRDELAKLQQAERRKQTAAAEKTKLADLEAKVKQITEQKPVEHRRSTRLMRWAD